MSYNKLNRDKKFDKSMIQYKNHPNYKDIKKLYVNNIIKRIDSTEKLFNKVKLTKAGKLYKTSEKLSKQLGIQSQTFKVEATIKRFNKDSINLKSTPCLDLTYDMHNYKKNRHMD